MTHLQAAGIKQPRIDGDSAKANQHARLVRVDDFAGDRDQSGLVAYALIEQALVEITDHHCHWHHAGLGIEDPVIEDDDAHAPVPDGIDNLFGEVLQALLEVFFKAGGKEPVPVAGGKMAAVRIAEGQ